MNNIFSINQDRDGILNSSDVIEEEDEDISPGKRDSLNAAGLGRVKHDLKDIQKENKIRKNVKKII
jgi:hypothetical protein